MLLHSGLLHPNVLLVNMWPCIHAVSSNLRAPVIPFGVLEFHAPLRISKSKRRSSTKVHKTFPSFMYLGLSPSHVAGFITSMLNLVHVGVLSRSWLGRTHDLKRPRAVVLHNTYMPTYIYIYTYACHRQSPQLFTSNMFSFASNQPSNKSVM